MLDTGQDDVMPASGTVSLRPTGEASSLV